MAILYPTSLVNLVVEVGTRHCHTHQDLILWWRLYTDMWISKLSYSWLTQLKLPACILYSPVCAWWWSYSLTHCYPVLDCNTNGTEVVTTVACNNLPGHTFESPYIGDETPEGVGGVLGQVSDRDAQHRPSTRNATRVKKKGRSKDTFCPILMKNRGRYTTFSSFLLKYMGRNYTNFPETWKRGVEIAEHM